MTRGELYVIPIAECKDIFRVVKESFEQCSDEKANFFLSSDEVPCL